MLHNLVRAANMLIIMMKTKALFIWLIQPEFKNHPIKGGDLGQIKGIFAGAVVEVEVKELGCSLLAKESKQGTLTKELKLKNGDKEG